MRTERRASPSHPPGMGALLALLAVASCARPISRSCGTNRDCGGAASCVASRCEAKGGTPALQKDERRVERPRLVGQAPRGDLGRFEVQRGEDLLLDLTWPTDERTVHEAFLLLHVDSATEPTTLEAAVLRRESGEGGGPATDRVVFARAFVARGDESMRLDLSRLAALARPEGGRYRIAIRPIAGRSVTILLDGAGAGAGPIAEWYLGAN